MDEYRLVRRPRISRRDAHEMVLLFAKHANHYTTRERFVTDADVKRAFERNGIAFDRLVESCRDPSSSVPFFENIIGSTWAVSGGATVSRVNLETGEESNRVQGPGTYAPEGYWATYELAHEALERCVQKRSYTEFLSAVVHGIAAIEGFVRAMVLEWNKTHPDDPLIDSRESRVTFDDKIQSWVPRMSGARLNKGMPVWQQFTKLRAIRDDEAIHAKSAGFAVRLPELADLLNRFRVGIPGLLIDLHIVFAQRIPRVIIRDRYAPDVEVTRQSGSAA